MEHLVHDFVHIAQTLKEYGPHIGHQLIGEGRLFEPTFPEFVSFSKLINGVKKDVKSLQ